MRAVINVHKGSSKEDALETALSEENVKRYIENKESIKKVVFVPDKIMNLIT